MATKYLDTDQPHSTPQHDIVHCDCFVSHFFICADFFSAFYFYLSFFVLKFSFLCPNQLYFQCLEEEFQGQLEEQER